MPDPRPPRGLAALAASAFLAVGPALQAGPRPAPGRDRHHQGPAGLGRRPRPQAQGRGRHGRSKKDAVCKAKQIVSKELTVDPGTKGIADAFAYLVKPDRRLLAAAKALVEKTPQVVIDQDNCEYLPYATGDPQGPEARSSSRATRSATTSGFNAFANGADQPDARSRRQDDLPDQEGTLPADPRSPATSTPG